MKTFLKLFVVLGLIVIGCAIAIVYFRSSGIPSNHPGGVIPNAVKALVEPWNVRAQKVVAKMFNTVDGASLAQAAIKIAHPTGKNPQLTKYDVNPSGDGITANFEITWQGELTGKDYQTLVVWECNQKTHVRANVTQDTAPTAVDDKSQAQLDDYFRTEVYPVLCKNLQ